MKQIASKWVKFAILKADTGMAKHIPDTRRYSSQHLSAMLRRYSFVVAKPVVGTGGSGVVRISPSGKGYRVQYGETVRQAASLRETEHILAGIRGKRAYILQQGIRLATLKGKPMDYRVKLVKDNGNWSLRAVVARVAKPGLFVTNLCRGGTMIGGNRALRLTFPSAARDKFNALVQTARSGTALLEQKLPGIGALGFDFGIDKEGAMWILEVNTRPH